MSAPDTKLSTLAFGGTGRHPVQAFSLHVPTCVDAIAIAGDVLLVLTGREVHHFCERTGHFIGNRVGSGYGGFAVYPCGTKYVHGTNIVDVTTRAVLATDHRIGLNGETVRKLCIADGGYTVVVASHRGTIYRVPTATPWADPVTSVIPAVYWGATEVSRDGKSVIHGYACTYRVSVRSIESGEPLAEYDGLGSQATALAIPHSEGPFASTGSDGVVHLWGPGAETTLLTDPHPADPCESVHCMAFTPNDRFIVASTNAGAVIRVWDVATGELTQRIASPERNPVVRTWFASTFTISPCGCFVFAGGRAGVVHKRIIRDTVALAEAEVKTARDAATALRELPAEGDDHAWPESPLPLLVLECFVYEDARVRLHHLTKRMK